MPEEHINAARDAGVVIVEDGARIILLHEGRSVATECPLQARDLVLFLIGA